MTKRHIPGIEALEARATPDVSLAAANLLPSLAAEHVAVHTPLAESLPDVPSSAPDDALLPSGFSVHAVDRVFAQPRGIDLLLHPDAADRSGWQFLGNYTRKAIRNEELRYGPLPDHEDIEHQVFVEWREQVGTAEQAMARLLDKESPERLVLRKTVRQVLDRVRYQAQRQQRTVELLDQPAPSSPAAQDWIDLQLDWDLGGARPSPRERQILELRRQGKTFEEIGTEMGLLKQRVCELYQGILDHLQERYNQL
jgi:hypothetical protein